MEKDYLVILIAFVFVVWFWFMSIRISKLMDETRESFKKDKDRYFKLRGKTYKRANTPR
jgi:uncharacterized membrane protein YqjE